MGRGEMSLILCRCMELHGKRAGICFLAILVVIKLLAMNEDTFMYEALFFFQDYLCLLHHHHHFSYIVTNFGGSISYVNLSLELLSISISKTAFPSLFSNEGFHQGMKTKFHFSRF